MATKKPKKTSRVSPNPSMQPTGVIFENLLDGDAFIFNGALWMKCDCGDQEAINLDTGSIQSAMCEEVVIPVDVNITWSRK